MNIELGHDDLQKVMSSVDIPACPSVVTEAMQEAQKDEPNIKHLAAIIAGDAGMSAAALKLANSPLYGNAQRLSSVRHAVERLGTKNIVCVVVSAALRNSITGLPAAWLEQFWRRNTLLAVAASLIAKRQYGISPDMAYTYTLFHDAAIPLMMRRFPNYGEVMDRCINDGSLLHDAEAEFFPCSHPVVGSLLVRNWGLPPLLGQAIRLHHEPEVFALPERSVPGAALSLIAITQIAEHLLAEIQSANDCEVGDALFAAALKYLGLCDDDLDDLRQAVGSALEESL